MYFAYGQKEIEYLCRKDKALGEAILQIGPLQREVDPNLFSSLVSSIVSQQISAPAYQTVWKRFESAFGQVTPQAIAACTTQGLQAFGISFRKAEYIADLAARVNSGGLDIEALRNKPDEEVIKELSALRGIGVWTAEMLLIFCLQRPNVLSFGDLAIHRGLRMLYRHRKITKELFEKYRSRYSPYASVASLYLWAISSGAIKELKDNAPVPKPKARPKAKQKSKTSLMLEA